MADATERPTSVTAAPLPPPEPAVSDAPSDQPYQPLSLLAVLGFTLAALYVFLVLLGGLVPIAGRYPRLFALMFIAAPLVGAQVALLSRGRAGVGVAASAGIGAGVLALILGLGGLLAYSSSNPWLLLEGVAGWGLVLAAVVVCLLARSRIAASEGTLGGAALAAWGLTLSLCFGLLYARPRTSATASRWATTPSVTWPAGRAASSRGSAACSSSGCCGWVTARSRSSARGSARSSAAVTS
jgi:hypothetical protein